MDNDKRPYHSKYTDKNVTAGQHLAELACEKIADYNKKEALPYKFWNSPEWTNTFKSQLLAANALLKIYKPKVIAEAIKECKSLPSLRVKWFDEYLKKNNERLSQKVESSNLIVSSTMEKPAVFTPKNNNKVNIKDL